MGLLLLKLYIQVSYTLFIFLPWRKKDNKKSQAPIDIGAGQRTKSPTDEIDLQVTK